MFNIPNFIVYDPNKDIFKGLMENVAITKLDLSYNGFTDKCGPAIGEFLKGFKTLRLC